MADAFLQALAVVLFVFTTWLFGAVARRLSAPALVGEVVAGMVLGPKGLDAVPHDEAFALIGAVGLALLVLEGGLHVELATLRRVGKVAFAVALSGTVLPLATAWAALALLPAFRSREGLLCGTALSSTAIGMAAQLMGDLGVLDAELGQVVVTAAMFDDVLSLCLLAMVSKGLGDGAFALFLPLLSSAAFIFATAALAYKTPEWLGALRQRRQFTDAAWRDGLLALALGLCVALSAAAHFAKSTHLLGAFMAGVSLAAVDGGAAAETFDDRVGPVSAWTSRVFFASIGFVVPVGRLFSAPALLYGALLAFLAVGSKVVTGVFDWERRYQIGWAMVGRGELGFVMATETFKRGETSSLAFSITVWALLVATLVSPIVLRRLLPAPPPARAAAVEDVGALKAEVARLRRDLAAARAEDAAMARVIRRLSPPKGRRPSRDLAAEPVVVEPPDEAPIFGCSGLY